MPRKEYPSDHRRWFRVLEGILDDPGYRGLNNGDKAIWIDLLATFNRMKAHKTGNAIVLALRDATFVMGSRTTRDLFTRARRLTRGVDVLFARVPEGVLIYIPKWAEIQELTPSGLPRSSAATPCTTPSPTPTPIQPPPTVPPPSEPAPEQPPGKPARGGGAQSRSAKLDARVDEVWPTLQERANLCYGRAWRDKPGRAARMLLRGRIEDGATDEQLVKAIDGCATYNPPNDPDRRKYIRPETVYQPSKFDGYVDAAEETTPKGKPKTQTDLWLERTGQTQPLTTEPRPDETDEAEEGAGGDRHGMCHHTDRNLFACPKCGGQACRECLQTFPCREF